MMFGFITKARHDREMAAKDVHIHQLDRTAEAFRRDRDAFKAEVDRIEAAAAKSRLDEYDRLILAQLGDGARTFQIATRMGFSTATTRKRLYKLEQAGVVVRDLERSAVNDVRWLPAPPSGDAA